jgi:UDP-N-acetyl-D-glucosamine dehydrogenase
LILGLAYKKNVDDERESPCIEILDKLIKAGALVDYSDPHIPKFKKKRNYNYDMKSVELSPEVLSSYDAVVLTTDHDRFDYDLIINHSKLIIDARGKYRGEKSNVIKA